MTHDVPVPSERTSSHNLASQPAGRLPLPRDADDQRDVDEPLDAALDLPLNVTVQNKNTHIVTVLAAVITERNAQDEKWGEQNHPNGTGDVVYLPSPHAAGLPDVFGARYLADFFRERCQIAARRDKLTWLHILLEEVFEAAAEKDPDKLRDELIQVAAVVVQWVQSIDRAAAKAETEVENRD